MKGAGGSAKRPSEGAALRVGYHVHLCWSVDATEEKRGSCNMIHSYTKPKSTGAQKSPKQNQLTHSHKNSLPPNPPHTLPSQVNAILFLISAIASAGFSPFGHVLEQFKIVWQRYRLMLLLRASWRSAFFSSRESAIQRYDCSSTAGPRYSSLFHQ